MREFTKTVRTTYRTRWVAKKFLTYTENFRTIRSLHEYKMNECFKCMRPFEDQEAMALASFEKVSNKALCQECAEYLSNNSKPNKEKEGLGLEVQDRSKLEGSIAGALRDAINQHGPIFPKNIGSAAKRVYGVLKQIAKDK